jgi:hypothetical protein
MSAPNINMNMTMDMDIDMDMDITTTPPRQSVHHRHHHRARRPALIPHNPDLSLCLSAAANFTPDRHHDAWVLPPLGMGSSSGSGDGADIMELVAGALREDVFAWVSFVFPILQTSPIFFFSDTMH